MKLRYYFIALLGLLFFATSCEEDFSITQLDEVKVNSSYVALPAAGGSTTITVDATDAWEITDIPAWLTVAPVSGTAGVTDVKFTAEKAANTNEGMVKLVCAGKTQIINVLQQTAKVELAITPVNQITSEGTFRAKGVATGFYSPEYGNFYLVDETGSILVYGLLDKNGKTKGYPFTSWGLDEGDEVTIEGVVKNYNGTMEFVDAAVLNITKSLIKVEEQPATIGKDGGEASAKITYKGNEYTFSIPEEYKSWLSVSGTEMVGDTTVVTFYAQPNEGGAREATVQFASSNGKQTSEVSATIMQEGAIAEVCIAEFNAAEVGTAQYKITGVITSVAKAAYGNVYLKDYSGETYVYGIGAKGDFEALGLKEGDIVTVIGTRGQYGETIEMMGGQYVSHTPVTTVTIEEFNAKDDGTDWYRLTGSVRAANDDELAAGCKNDMATYGNFVLEDESGSVYVYGLTTGYNGVSKQFATLGVDYGDEVTIIAQKSTYKGLIEANKAMYVSHANK